ncbi:MAG TPA: sulfur carrier protein ThiS [Bryobacteraceae bacterium]|nr:sulfur carrier protein ThiS [Bryobacteraceae bacterium]
MEIVLNGVSRDVPDGLTLRDLLLRVEIDPERVAVELNRNIVRRGEWTSRVVEPGACIEVVQFVGGG